MPKKQPAVERFWKHVSKGSPDECWEWTGMKTDRGHGQMKVQFDGRYCRVTAHRFSYRLHHPLSSELTPDMSVYHRCESPSCVNPHHLCLERPEKLNRRPYTRRPLPERFWKHVEKGTPDECWEWTGAQDEKGYGRFSCDLEPGKFRVIRAHKVSYYICHPVSFEPSPKVWVGQHCGNPSCVNPYHLFLEADLARVRLEEFRQRFWRRVSEGPPDKCWMWKGRLNGEGYGLIVVRGRNDRKVSLPAHRASYYLHHPVPLEMPLNTCICHTCDVKACVNPYHLYWGDHQTNAQDYVVRGGSGRIKLTEDDVRAIRRKLSSGSSAYELAKEYGVADGHIYQIKNRRAWAFVEDE